MTKKEMLALRFELLIKKAEFALAYTQKAAQEAADFRKSYLETLEKEKQEAQQIQNNENK